MDVKHDLLRVTFTWDPEKAGTNLCDHSVSFEEACEVFFDPLYKMIADDSVEGEQRWGFIGLTKNNRPLFVVGAEQGEDAWRIISARELGKQERLHYEEEDDPY